MLIIFFHACLVGEEQEQQSVSFRVNIRDEKLEMMGATKISFFSSWLISFFVLVLVRCSYYNVTLWQ